MSRSKSVKKRQTKPDPRYNSLYVSRLINRVMLSGKKTVAENNVYSALEIVEKQTGKKAIDALELALKNITPLMEVRSRRVGGAAYQVPVPVKTFRGTSLAIRWLVTEASKRPSKELHTIAQKLAAEIGDAINETGGAFQKKLNVHKMADANKAFAHFRW